MIPIKKSILAPFAAVAILLSLAGMALAADIPTTAEVRSVETGPGETETVPWGIKTTFKVGSDTKGYIDLSDTKGKVEKVTLGMEKGDVTVKVNAGLGKRVETRVTTPNLVAKGIIGEYQVTHDASAKLSVVKSNKGTVTVTDEKGRNKTLVRKGYATVVDEGGMPTKPVRVSKLKSAPKAVEPAPAAKSDAPSFATFTFGPGVSAEDEAIIRKGVADMANHLKKWFGRTVTNATAVKTTADASDTTCCNVGGSGSGAWIAVHTKHTDWIKAKLAAFLFTDMRQQMTLHELVHTYQTQYGCGKQEQPVALRWYNEGMAEWLAFRAMVEMGVVTEAKVLEYNQFMYKSAKAEILSAYELYHKEIDYSVFYLAVDQLMKKSPITSLSAFCDNLGKGQGKTDAFQSAFGTSLSQFYTDYEAYRKGL